MSHDDALSLSMFWTGALMVFTPLITASVVIFFVWRQRRKEAQAGGGYPRRAPEQPRGT